MSNSPKTVAEVAERVSSTELPHGRLTQTNATLLGEYMERQQTRETITHAMRSFSAMTKLLMPGETIDAYIRKGCREKTMPDIYRGGVPTSFTPGWASSKPGNFNSWNPDGTLNPAASVEKYTYEDILGSITLSHACPEVPISLLMMQGYLEEYFQELRACIAVTHPEKAASLEQFQYHWVEATNLMRVMTTAFSMKMQCERNADAIDHIDQSLVTSAFEMLEDMKAFDFVIPDLSLAGIQGMTFSCPAKPLLRELFVDRGAYMVVVERLRGMRDGKSANQGIDMYILQAFKDVISKITAPILRAVEKRDIDTVRALADLGESRLKQRQRKS